MVNSIVINRSALNIMVQEPEYNKSIKDFMPTQHEFDTLEDLSFLLFPLKDFITCLSSQNYTTLSMLFLLYFALAKGPIEDPPVTPANAPVKIVNDQRSKIQSLFVSLMDDKHRQPGKKGGKIEEELNAYKNSNWSSNDESLIHESKAWATFVFSRKTRTNFPSLAV